jgi:hypothetical protein
MKMVIDINEGKSLEDISKFINEIQDHMKEHYDDCICNVQIKKCDLENVIDKLQANANLIIKTYNGELIGMKRKNSLIYLAKMFGDFENRCVWLAENDA